VLISLIVMGTWLFLRQRNPSIGFGRVAASAIGVFGGLLGMEHGFFEILQGSVRPRAVMMYAIGSPPCQPAAIWHGCEPAMTLIPNFLLTGILAMLISLVTLVWAARFVQRRSGGWVLVLLSIVMLLVGGGFFPPLFGIVAGLIGTRLKPR
jgi:hypothetical protein